MLKLINCIRQQLFNGQSVDVMILLRKQIQAKDTIFQRHGQNLVSQQKISMSICDSEQSSLNLYSQIRSEEGNLKISNEQSQMLSSEQEEQFINTAQKNIKFTKNYCLKQENSKSIEINDQQKVQEQNQLPEQKRQLQNREIQHPELNQIERQRRVNQSQNEAQYTCQIQDVYQYLQNLDPQSNFQQIDQPLQISRSHHIHNDPERQGQDTCATFNTKQLRNHGQQHLQDDIKELPSDIYVKEDGSIKVWAQFLSDISRQSTIPISTNQYYLINQVSQMKTQNIYNQQQIDNQSKFNPDGSQNNNSFILQIKNKSKGQSQSVGIILHKKLIFLKQWKQIRKDQDIDLVCKKTISADSVTIAAPSNNFIVIDSDIKNHLSNKQQLLQFCKEDEIKYLQLHFQPHQTEKQFIVHPQNFQLYQWDGLGSQMATTSTSASQFQIYRKK